MSTECPCSKSELDVCRPIDVQVAMTEGRWQTYYPINSLSSGNGVMEFSVPGTTNEVIDMNNISLYIRGKIKKNATTALGADNKVHPANNMLHTMIRHIDVSINGQLVTRAGKDYAYKAYLVKLTQHDMPGGGGDKDPQLILEGFSMDKEGKANTIDGNAGTADRAEPGGVKRQKLIAASREFELVGNPCVDLFQCERSLIMNCDIALKIYLNDPTFFLVEGTETQANKVTAPILSLSEVELRVRRVQVAPSFVNALVAEVQNRDAIYPFTRREILTFNIPKDTTLVTKENIFRGYLANRFFIALVDSEAYNGTLAKNPLYLEHAGIKEISLAENGLYMAYNPLKLDLNEKGRGATAYRYFLESIGAIGERALSTPVTYDHYCNGSTIFCFTRSPDLTHGLNHLPPQTASITLQMSFKAATTATLTAIVLAEYDSRLQITKDNNIITDYGI